ncbi:MAG: flagellar biosynthetic protein FliR [Pseudomonadota bacterium]
MTFALDSLPFNALVFIAVFCRVGALFMAAPALGDFSLIPRIRLMAALTVTLALVPAVAGFYPATLSLAGMADQNVLSASGLAIILLKETGIGLFLGLMARVFVSALNIAGQIIAFQIGLSLAQIFDPTQQLQGAIIGGFLAVFGTTMIFVTDLHHGLLFALRDSYALFVPGGALPIGDMTAAMVETLGQAFSLGVRLAAPFILFGLIFYGGAGILNRLIPQVQVFFMLLPANLLLGLFVFMLMSGLMMSWFLSDFATLLGTFSP